MKKSSKPPIPTDRRPNLGRVENEDTKVKVSMAKSKRKADNESKREEIDPMELCLLSAYTMSDLNDVNRADVKRGKRAHSPSGSCKTTNNAVTQSNTEKVNGYRNGGAEMSLPASSRSRLQKLQDHGIMQNVLSFLDETGLFQLENAHYNMIGSFAIARQWSALFICDENKVSAHKRWRPITEMDVIAIGNKTSATSEGCDYGSQKISDCEFTMNGQRCKKDLLARRMGRKFAQEAIFVRERAKEASQIYDFDRMPKDENDVPLFMDHRSLMDTKESTSLPTQPSSQFARMHWAEWYDFRANSVNEKYAFVRLSLRDGSMRFWHGFRRLTTNYNTTFFCLHFDMKELIKDMQWTELEYYLKFNDTTYSSMQSRLKAIEPLMRMTQLTVALGGKLLIATGGYSPSFAGFSGKCYFHPRHYERPLADSTKNELEWLPYRACLADDSAQNELVIQFECDHANLPFMRAQDIGNPKACAHW